MYLDIVIVVVILGAIINGLRNGLFIEFLSIFGLLINFFVAKLLTPIIIDFLNLNRGDYIITYLIIFVAIYIITGMILHFFISIMEGQRKCPFIRFLGGLLGILKGFIVALVIVFCFNYASQNMKSLRKYQKDSYANEIFLDMIPKIEEYTPDAIKKELNRLKNGNFIRKYLKQL